MKVDLAIRGLSKGVPFSVKHTNFRKGGYGKRHDLDRLWNRGKGKNWVSLYPCSLKGGGGTSQVGERLPRKLSWRMLDEKNWAGGGLERRG